MCYDCELSIGLFDLEFGGIGLDAESVVVDCIRDHGGSIPSRWEGKLFFTWPRMAGVRGREIWNCEIDPWRSKKRRVRWKSMERFFHQRLRMWDVRDVRDVVVCRSKELVVRLTFFFSREFGG
jgi:hypothetical protein